MPLIKPRTPPFATKEEALEFLKRHGDYEFKKKIEKYSHSLQNLHVKLLVFIFPLYIALASLVWLFDYKEINYQAYLFLRFLHIPVQHPYGWNVSYILSFLINIILFFPIIKAYDFSLIRKIVRVKRDQLFVFYVRHIFFILIIFFFLFVAQIATMPKRSTACTVATYCWLQSDSMFLHSSLLLYMGFSGVSIMLTIFLYIRFTLPYLEIKIDE